MKPEWMIVPDVDIAVEIGSAFHKGDKYTNLDLVKITGRLYQRKLLEYLILNDSDCKSSDKEWYMRPNNRIVLESMLKELEALQ